MKDSFINTLYHNQLFNDIHYLDVAQIGNEFDPLVLNVQQESSREQKLRIVFLNVQAKCLSGRLNTSASKNAHTYKKKNKKIKKYETQTDSLVS